MRSITPRGEVEVRVNGERRHLPVRAADTLLWTLRDGLGLTGAKPGCENGDCGACTVLVDGVPTKSCMVLAAEVEGRSVDTVEGLHQAPAQKAFIDNWAFQCGYCTSGFLMVTQGLSRMHPDADEDRIVEWLRSNICRCTGYQEINSAVRWVLEDATASRGQSEPEKASPREPAMAGAASHGALGPQAS
jgi:carbon-monoxide dehydrogenase small subunit